MRSSQRQAARRFTLEEIQIVRERAAAGVYCSAIAKQLGRAPNSVRELCRKHGIDLPLQRPAARPFEAWEIATVSAMTSAGYDATSIARRINRTPMSIRSFCSNRGWRLRTGTGDKAEVRCKLDVRVVRRLRRLGESYGLSLPAFCRLLLLRIVNDGLAGAVIDEKRRR
jgi:hypothetical protein